MRPHDVSGACGHTPPRRPHPAGVRASGQRAATPPAAIGSRPARGLFATPSAGYSSARFASRYRRGSAGIRGKLQKSRPENSSATPLGGLFFNPGFASRRRGRHACRGKLWTQSVRERFATPSAGCSFRLGNVIIPHLPSSGSHAPDQVPDSVTDIDRPAARCRSTAGP